MIYPHYSDESYGDIKNKTVNDIVGQTIRFDIDELHGFVNSWRQGYSKQGLVLTLTGGWGAGKSTVAWALINKLRDDEPGSYFIQHKNLLPFANINEAVRKFLGEFATDLKESNIAKIDKEIVQFITDATPADDAYNLSFKMFGIVDVGRKLGGSRRYNYEDALVREFAQIRTRKSKTVVVVLEDIDRLKPDEIIVVLRLVEKLRILPGVIVVLPMYKDIVRGALESQLGFASASSRVFLRKLTDYELVLRGDVKDLEVSFKRALGRSLKDPDATREWGRGDAKSIVTFVDVIWAMFVHIATLKAAIQYAETGDEERRPTRAMLTMPAKSEYLHNLMLLLRATAYGDKRAGERPEEDQKKYYPVFHSKQLMRFGYRWDGLRSMTEKRWQSELRDLLDSGSSASSVNTHASIADALEYRDSVPYDEFSSLEDGNKIPVFIEVFMKEIEKSQHEQYIQDSYRHRDVMQIARAIGSIFNSMTLSEMDERAIEEIYHPLERIIDEF